MRKKMTRKSKLQISELMPDSGKVLLTGTGKDFVARVGEQLIREAVLGVLCGENLRSQTEFLTRNRISQLSTAIFALYFQGKLRIPDFSSKLLDISLAQLLAAKRNNNADVWPAQWFMGLTGKSVQNVLKSNPKELDEYLTRFNASQDVAIARAEDEFGKLNGTLGFVKDGKTGETIELQWRDLLQLMTAIGAQTLTIRGSDKSLYGKLFEKLVLGSVLCILGYKRVERPESIDVDYGVFWLSDGTGHRESDATLLYKSAAQVRFDIGFIGPGNPEISKDKLSRFSSEPNKLGSKKKTYTKTFIIVDRLPQTGKTQAAAKAIGADIIQMSMHYWPRNLAHALSKVTKAEYEVATVSDAKIKKYLASKLANISLLSFLDSVRLDELMSNSISTGEDASDSDEA